MTLKIVCAFLGCGATLAAADSNTLARQLDEVARIGSVMVDGDVCEQIMTSRAVKYLLQTDPRDQWAAADNYDVDHAAFIATKKTLIRLGRLGPPHTDVNLWMPVPGDASRIQIVIRNANEISQFWRWGDLHQSATEEMKQVLSTGERKTVASKSGYISVLAPVRNSLGEIVGLLEAVTQTSYDPHGNVK